jgi:MFS family permease
LLISIPPASDNSHSMFGLPRAVWILGWVSLATDAASEAIYPLLPFFLVQVLGAGVVSLGIIEGSAEAINSVLKVLSGRAADRARSKRGLVLAGYALSSTARPLIALAQTWTHVFGIRLLDRVGKGIRSAPRDAMLAGWATSESRGRIYGFHRAMDHAGAVLGPLLASLFLWFRPGEYRTLFALAIIPGVIAVALVFLVPSEPAAPRAPLAHTEPPAAPSTAAKRPGSSPPADERLPPRFRSYMLVLGLFTLGNSTDAFLLLKLTDSAGSAAFIPLIWAAHHVVKAGVSVVGGSWSDRIGRRSVIALGWLVYAAVYLGFAASTSFATLLTLFLVYGFYFGLTEGTEKALVADLAPVARRGFAFGVFTAVQGLGALAASVVFGLIWNAAGPAIAFAFGAALALIATALLFVVVPART